MSALGHEHKNTFTYTWEIIANSKRGKKKEDKTCQVCRINYIFTEAKTQSLSDFTSRTWYNQCC